MPLISMEIPDISTKGIDIRDVTIPEVRDWAVSAPTAIPPASPIVDQVGVPIVDIPGCVEAHESNNKSNTCLLYTSPSPRDVEESRMPSSA